MKEYIKKAAATRNSGAFANRINSFLFGVFRTVLFGFFVYSFYIASVFVENKTLNPSTKLRYNIIEIVTVC